MTAKEKFAYNDIAYDNKPVYNNNFVFSDVSLDYVNFKIDASNSLFLQAAYELVGICWSANLFSSNNSNNNC